MILQTELLSIGYEQKRQVLFVQRDLNLTVAAGELVCLTGPNGCGKSTLIRSIGGLQRPVGGNVWVAGQELAQSSVSERALLMSLVLTDRIETGQLTVSDVVGIGRLPYTGWLDRLSANDKRLIKKALEQVNLSDYGSRRLSELSDGERQRVMIGKALVQDTPLMLLDEPTAHLDLPNRIEIMLLLRNLAHDTGKAIIVSTHELDLALQIADHIWIMQRMKGVQTGAPNDPALRNCLKEAFESNAFSFNEQTGHIHLHHT